MALEQSLVDAVNDTSGVIDSAIVFIKGIEEQLRNMGGSKEEETALADQLKAKRQELANAIDNDPNT